MNAILSSLKLPQNFIILTSKSTPKFIQRTRGLELAATACLILVKFQKARESSKQGQGQLHTLIHAPLSLLSFLFLFILWYELQCIYISITLDTIDSRTMRKAPFFYWYWQELWLESVPQKMLENVVINQKDICYNF